MEQLITRSDIAQYKQISKTPHDAKLNECIMDAQILDLAPLLGETLFNKLVDTPASYTELLSGGDYTYKGTTYKNYGLKMVLSYYAYARYVYFSSAIDTSFSLVEKMNDTSRPVDVTQKKSIYTLNRDAAFQLWQNVRSYLIRTEETDFKECNTNQSPKGSFRLTKID